MMGPMMGGGSGWDTALIVLRKPGRSDADGQASPGTGPGEDPLIILRERYAHGEISHAELTHALDLPTPARPMPSRAVPGRLSHPAPHPHPPGQDGAVANGPAEGV